ncbi:MAG: NAD-dependent epimerase/dehydratase family protein [Oscillospiraceae bacterium]|nr:NAD-dependent epimerase/dehydratase family protein [Oscillospiraceae bacterium]
MLYQNKLWISDIDKTIATMHFLEALSGKSIMITGATGLIGSAVVDILFRYNDVHGTSINIIAAGRSYESMIRRFGHMAERKDFNFIPYDSTKTDNQLSVHADYVIHAAANANPGVVMKEPVETMLGNFLGIRELLDYAFKEKSKRVLYISSSEVYGTKSNDLPFVENEYGFIDILNPRNSYSVGKRAAETLCVSYAKEYGVESVIVRPGHIYGPTAGKQDNRVSSQWPFAVSRGENIVMKSDGAQIRSYCYCLDCASAILTILMKGDNCCAYNISNPDSVISIKQMAEILTACARVKLITETPTEMEKQGFNPMSNSSLNSDSLLALGWKGCFPAKEGFGHTVAILKDLV